MGWVQHKAASRRSLSAHRAHAAPATPRLRMCLDARLGQPGAHAACVLEVWKTTVANPKRMEQHVRAEPCVQEGQQMRQTLAFWQPAKTLQNQAFYDLAWQCAQGVRLGQGVRDRRTVKKQAVLEAKDIRISKAAVCELLQAPDMATKGVAKVLARLEESVKDGNYYEAQQMYKSTYHRCKAKNNFEEGYTVLKDGARRQLEHGQVACGSELLRLLSEGYLEQNLEAKGKELEEMQQLLSLFSARCDEACNREECVLELRRAVGAAAKWCLKCGDRHAIRKLFSTAGASIMAIQGWRGLGAATQYYCLSDDMNSFAAGVKEGMAAGKPDEADLFKARAVLQVLAAARKETIVTQLELARELWNLLPDQEGKPLEHFMEFLLVALGKLSQPLFDLLFSEYQESLKRDDFLWSLVDRIGSVFFARGQAGGGGALGDLLGNLLGSLG